jgi:transketolase
LQQYGWPPGDESEQPERGDRGAPWPDEMLRRAFEGFGWRAVETDGHDFGAIVGAFADAGAAAGGDRPTAILARTVKGRGLSFTEGRYNWHARIPTADEIEAARVELGIDATGQLE